MSAELNIDGRRYEFDASAPIDISIPLRFNRPQPNAYGVEPASSAPCEIGELVGDTRLGGSCNFEEYILIPHCNGTHTECVGHITHKRVSVRDRLRDALVPAALITIEPEGSAEVEESYSMTIDSDDRLITRRILENALDATGNSLTSVIIRTSPNDRSKLTRRYVDDVPPYFTNEAMQFLVDRGVKHLLVDLPSIDRLHDEGRLSNHRIFWNMEPGSFEMNESTRKNATITELIYVPDSVEDGKYILNLQVAPFEADASPSRPFLFRVTQN